VEEIQGTFYDVVFKRSPSGNPIITKKPDMSNVEWSKAQMAHREKFALASDYATAAKAEPSVWAAYQKRAKRLHKRPRDLAISDYFKGKDLLTRKSAPPKRKKASADTQAILSMPVEKRKGARGK
jgi:hypothetical protein